VLQATTLPRAPTILEVKVLNSAWMFWTRVCVSRNKYIGIISCSMGNLTRNKFVSLNFCCYKIASHKTSNIFLNLLCQEDEVGRPKKLCGEGPVEHILRSTLKSLSLPLLRRPSWNDANRRVNQVASHLFMEPYCHFRVSKLSNQHIDLVSETAQVIISALRCHMLTESFHVLLYPWKS
jgi:hypothetical protein